MLRPMLRPMVLNPLRRIGTPAWGTFSPRGLFAAGEQGVWYDPSDLSSLFQDAGATQPVTSVGQPVVLARDKSGRGNHLTLANCTLQADGSGFLHFAFNGTTTGGSTAAINITGTDKVTVWAGLYKASDTTTGVVAELSVDSNVNTGTFAVFAPLAAGAAQYGWRSRGSLTAAATGPSAFAAPHAGVITGSADIGADVCQMRVNGAVHSTVAADQGTGNYGNFPLYVGRRAGTSNPLSGRIYGLIVRGAATDAARLAQTERWMARKMGVVL